MSEARRPNLKMPDIDMHEHGATIDGVEQKIDRRLFVQLIGFSRPEGVSDEEVRNAVARLDAPYVLYHDVQDPRGYGLVTYSEDPGDFLKLRALFSGAGIPSLKVKPELSMLGRTYSQGYERDLADWIIERPKRTMTNPDWPWAVWYPLRRNGEFATLSEEERASILREHAVIGRGYGQKDFAHDVRLASHGLDTNDNEFVIGLVGKSLHPLSKVVETMRKTKQTALFIQKMGPFFVGRRVAHG